MEANQQKVEKSWLFYIRTCPNPFISAA